MKGDDRVRFCELCNLNVYNFAQLTHREVNALVAKTEGRLCGRLYRRADNTVITKDCPVGLRAVRRRVSRIATAVFTAMTSVCSLALGQKQSGKDKSSCKQQVTITRQITAFKTESAVVSGKVLDPAGAVIAKATISVFDRGTKKSFSTESNDSGDFRISGLPPAQYDFLVEAPGFKQLTVRKIKIEPKEAVNLELLLTLGEVTMGIIIYGTALSATPGKTTIDQELIRRLPR